MKLLLIDLDGTVRQPKSGAKFISQPDDQELIFGVEEAIALYSDWTIVGITNQGGVAAGHKSLDDAIQEQKITIDLTNKIINEIYLCPDFEGLHCIHCGYRGDTGDWGCMEMNPISREELGGFRKPDPGMLNLAIDNTVRKPREILYVGDREEDQLAAQAAGVQFMWADQWRSLPAMYSKGQG